MSYYVDHDYVIYYCGNVDCGEPQTYGLLKVGAAHASCYDVEF
jgi:hypothetical protein